MSCQNMGKVVVESREKEEAGMKVGRRHVVGMKRKRETMGRAQAYLRPLIFEK